MNAERFPEARCLDGSPAVFYLREAPSEATARWIVSLQGGSACRFNTHKLPTVEVNNKTHEAGSDKIVPLDCADRAKEPLGSSVHDPPEKDISYKEVLSTDPVVNPVFHNWNTVLARYCDGSAWIGSTDVEQQQGEGGSGPTSTKYYLRGAANLLGIIGTLMSDHGMYTASEIVLHGCSVGAEGALGLGSLVQEAVPEHTMFAVIADSGMMMLPGHPSAVGHEKIWDLLFARSLARYRLEAKAEGFHDLVQRFAELNSSRQRYEHRVHLLSGYSELMEKTHVWSSNATVPAGCQDWFEELGFQRGQTRWLCHWPLMGLAFGQFPVFILNSIYDSWNNYVEESEGIEFCKKDPKCRRYWSLMAKEFESQISWSLSKRRERHPDIPLAGFLDHCPHHCRKWNMLRDEQNKTNAQHVAFWLAAVRSWHVSKLRQGPPQDAYQRFAGTRVVWQKRGADFPCEECCA